MNARAVALGIWSLGLAYATEARAGNDDGVLVGNRAAMVGGAVAATVDDASSIWYNPGGLGSVQRAQIDVSGTVYAGRLYIVPEFIAVEGGPSKRAMVSEFLTVPAQVAFARELKPGVTLGLGYFAPQAASFVLREELDVGNERAGSRWQVTATSSEIQHIFAAAVGGSAQKGLRLGLGLNAGYQLTAETVSVFGEAHENFATQGAANQSVVVTSTRLSAETVLGLQWDAARTLTLGLTLRSPRMLLRETKESSFAFSTASGSGDPDAQSGVTSSFYGKLRRLKAGRIAIGFAYHYAGGYLSAEIDAQPGLEEADVQVHRRAFANARFGLYHALTRALAVGVGVFSDRAPEAETPGLLSARGDFYGATSGIELSNEHFLAPSERVKSLIFNSVIALRYAFSQGDFGETVVDPERLSTGEAAFRTVQSDIVVHEFALYVGSGLKF